MNLRKVFCTYRIALPESLNIAEMTLRHIPDHPARSPVHIYLKNAAIVLTENYG